MSDEAPSKSGKVWLYVMGLLVSLPVCYVLSVGPMVVLVARSIIPESVMEPVYRPLSQFISATGTREPIEAYVVAWLKLTNTPFPK